MTKIEHIHRGLTFEATVNQISEESWSWAVEVLWEPRPKQEGLGRSEGFATAAAFNAGRKLIDLMLRIPAFEKNAARGT